MRILIFGSVVLSVLLFLSSCDKESESTPSDLPSCIESMVNDPSNENIQRIRIQEVDGEWHYWLNTEATFYDGTEYIVNMQCETVCFFCGECIFPECNNDYDPEGWETIWEQ